MSHSASLMENTGTLGPLLARSSPYLLVSPPRGCSTAFSRALSQHSQIGPYFHEPCGLYSYERTNLDTIVDALKGIKPGSLIKEMSFQFGDVSLALCFLKHARNPPVFLVRDPHLTLESRVRMVLGDLAAEAEASDSLKQRVAEAQAAKNYADMDDLLTEEAFPLARTGWQDMGDQMQACRDHDVTFLVVEASKFRTAPQEVLEKLCGYWGLTFEPGMLHWESRKQAPDGALSRHDAWYAKVAASQGVLPPQEHLIKAEHLPKRFREHLPVANAIYQKALNDSHVIR